MVFVDDEPLVLSGLANVLRRYRQVWEMCFVGSAEEALALFGTGTVDVIVSDLRMNKVDGMTLLRQVQQRYPDVVRVVLSGTPELVASVKASLVAHQFLVKPCPADALIQVLERAVGLRSVLKNNLVRQVVGGTAGLPSLPRVYLELNQALSDPGVSVPKLVRIVEQDAAMCAKLLQLVNSGFFGLGRRIGNIKDALAYLGTHVLRDVLLGISVFDVFRGRLTVPGFSMEREQARAYLAARIARRITSKERANDAYTAAMLQDLGRLILAVHLPNEVAVMRSAASRTGRPQSEVEQESWGFGHPAVASYLLGLWGLPLAIVEAVAHHHSPQRAARQEFDLVATTHVSGVLAEEQLPDERLAPAKLDAKYITAIGGAAHVAGWRSVAAEEALRIEA
ncbi:MAG: response regulator [Pseudomonadota bacterium]